MGDVHPLGNPHYWLDPENGKLIARAIPAQTDRASPERRAYFDQRLADFTSRLDAAEKRWLAALAPYKGAEGGDLPPILSRTSRSDSASTSSVTSSRGPGIPPTPQHTLDLIDEMKRQNIKLVMVEPYFDLKTPNAIGRETGARGAGAAAIGWRREGDHRLLHSCSTTTSTCVVNAIKKTGAESNTILTPACCSFSRRPSWRA